jgi:cyclopropane-fatty-acyl-phospholipid synthase
LPDPTTMSHNAASAVSAASSALAANALTAVARLPAGAPAAARAVFKLMRRLQHGTLDVRLPDGSHARFGNGQAPRAAIELHDFEVCRAALKSGDIGFAESFIDGHWHTPDLAALLRVFIANREQVEAVVYGSWWGSLLHRVKHWRNRNSRRGSAKNIHAHYDLGNEFYRLWLDESMSYSSAWFEGQPERPLAEAQAAKVRRALDAARVQPGARVLEIGCGWGGLAEVAARDYGAQVNGVTLSREQLAWAQARLVRASVDHLAQMRLQDYRDIADGPYDAVVSIEMFEAVGREYWPSFFAALTRNLKPGAHACLQSITIRDDLFDRYVRSSDFIQQYIFPGGLLPSVREFHKAAAQAGLDVIDTFAFGADYAETLRRWRAKFLAELPRIAPLGFDARFVRIWEFYLAYCEAAFDTGNTNVVQFTLRRAV